jgi:hypothetical protein
VNPWVLIGWEIEVIGSSAFCSGNVSSVRFESGTKLSEIGREAFSMCEELKAFNVPKSAVIVVSQIAGIWKRSHLKGHSD